MREPLPPMPLTVQRRIRLKARDALGAIVRRMWTMAGSYGAITPSSAAGRRFGSFGDGSIVCFPIGPVMNEHSIHLGHNVLIAADVTLSAGWGPDHVGIPEQVVRIGDRSLIGWGSAIVGHEGITIGDDVWTGHSVYITDMNHGYENLDLPISRQHQKEAPVSIGDGSWLGTGVIVLPGSTIGRHVVVGAGSVVVGDLPDHCVAVGAPARVIKIHDGERWVTTTADPAEVTGP